MQESFRRGIKPVELRDLYERAEQAGCTISITGGNHIRVRTPDGKVVHGPLTSGAKRAILNVRSQLRRAGVALP